MDVKDEEGLTGFSFIISNLGFNVVVSRVSDLTLNCSIVGTSLESSWKSSKDPNDWSDGISDGEWNSEGLSDSEDQVARVFDDKTNSSSGGDDDAIGISEVGLDFKDDLFRT